MKKSQYLALALFGSLIGCAGHGTDVGAGPVKNPTPPVDFGAAVAPTYQATVVSSDPVNTDTFLSGINDKGTVIGYSTPDASNPAATTVPFVWTSAGGPQNVAVSGTRAFPTAINGSGVVVGYVESPQSAWKFDGTTVSVIAPPPNETSIGAFAINDGGLIACAGPTKAYKLNGAVWTDLGTLSGASRPWAINATGTVVGESNNGTGNRRPVKFVDGGTPIDIMGGSSFTGNTGSAKSINDAGVISGYADVSANNSKAFFSTAAGTLVDISQSLSATFSEATWVNNKNLVVGSAVNAGSTTSFGWTPAQGLIDLTGRVTGVTGFTNLQVIAVNNSGVIVGNLKASNGREIGVVLTPAQS